MARSVLRHRRPVAALLILLVGLLTVPHGRASAGTAPLVRIGSAPTLPSGTRALAGASAEPTLHITVVLAPRAPGALAAYAAAVSDPSSPAYRRFLTPAAFAARFGPTAATVARVRAALARAGLTTGPLPANHLSLGITAPAGQLEHALHLTLARVRLPSRRAALVNLEAPALPASVAGDVQAIIGLDGREVRHPSLVRAPRRSRRPPNHTGAVRPRRHPRQPQACASAASTASAQNAYTANQIAGAYRLNGLYGAGDEGAGVTVGVYELEPNAPSDIAAYQSCYGTGTSIGYVPVDGGAGSGSGSGEAAFDIEQVIGLAPRARLLVYQAPNSNLDTPGSGPYDLFATMISQDRVSVITNSWGECEAVEGAAAARGENTLFQEAAIQGQTIISAAGDDGSEDCLQANSVPNTNLAVDDPGSQPYVTDVGGTSMTALGPPPTETTWNSGNGSLSVLGVQNGSGAGGGGISMLWGMPAYQSGAPASLGVLNGLSSGQPCGAGAGDCREVPDVAASADPLHGYLIYYNGDHSQPGAPSGWQATGGTSGASPLWAAVLALTNALPACHGSGVGFVNPALYRVAATDRTAFNDITTGNNDYTASHRGTYPATAGYDMATGLGTPNGTVLAARLCAESLRLGVPTGIETFLGESADVPVTVAAGAQTPGVRVTGLPPGVHFDAGTDRLSGTPTRVGVYAVTVAAATPDGAVRAVKLLWRVALAPRLTHLRLTGLADGRPVLSLRVEAGRAEAAPAQVTLTLPAGLSLRGGARIGLRSFRSAREVAHTTRAAGRTVRLRVTGTPVSPLLIRFPAGALAASRSLAGRLTFTAVVRDAAGRTSTVRALVRGAA